MNKLSEMSVTLLNYSVEDAILFYVVEFIKKKFKKKDGEFVKLSDEVFFDSEEFKPKYDYGFLLGEEQINFERLRLLGVAEINDIVVHENLKIERFNNNQTKLKAAYDSMIERIDAIEPTDCSYNFLCDFLNNLSSHKSLDCKNEVKDYIKPHDLIIRELNESLKRIRQYEFNIKFKLKEIEERCSEMNKELKEILKSLSQ
jgi:hypothetical protein